MRSRRYTLVLANRQTGVVRRFTIPLLPALAALSVALLLPILIGIGAAMKAKNDVSDVYVTAAALQVENSSFKATTEELAGQIQALQSAISELGAKAALDPSLQSAMDKLPAVVKSRAMGGASSATDALTPLTPGLRSPEDTFGLLRELLEGLESR